MRIVAGNLALSDWPTLWQPRDTLSNNGQVGTIPAEMILKLIDIIMTDPRGLLTGEGPKYREHRLWSR